jgi:hypothetical protein
VQRQYVFVGVGSRNVEAARDFHEHVVAFHVCLRVGKDEIDLLGVPFRKDGHGQDETDRRP